MSTSPNLIETTGVYVRRLLEGDGSGHDWWHIVRVRRLADWIAQREGAESTVVTLGALLHDVADWKFAGGDLDAGPAASRDWLRSQGASESLSDRVAGIVSEVSFKGAGVETVPTTLEGKVVQDADRLDAIGAIGIGRTFAYGGAKGRLLHDPEQPPVQHESFEAYRDSRGPSLNHFYEKLFLLADRMHTATARQLAAERQRFLHDFVKRFLEEWEGRDLSL